MRSTVHVLFVSCENAARSILAEACLNQLGGGRFKAFSCGMPGLAGGTVHPAVLEVLASAQIPADGVFSKPCDNFTRNGAPRMDFVIALDPDSVLQHPRWPGQPMTAVWSYPAILSGGRADLDIKRLALHTLYSLRRRLELLIALPMHGADRAALRDDIRDMAYMGHAA